MRTTTKLSLLIALCRLVAAAPALADKAAGDKCAKGLGPDPMKVYELAAPDVAADTDLKTLLRSKLKPMVQAGQMDRGSARAAAEAAGPCLKALQK